MKSLYRLNGWKDY